MTPTSVVATDTRRAPPVLDDETIAAVESAYVEAMLHLMAQEDEEGPPEKGTSEYCYPSEYPGADEDEPTRH